MSTNRTQVQVRIVNLDKVQDMLGRVGQAALRGMLKGTAKAALVVRADAIQRVMRSPKEGGEYYHRGLGRKTRASKAGAPPANQTGHLVQGINVVRQDLNGAVAVAIVRSSAEYAAAQEYGTLDGTLPERPYMRPALFENAAKIADLVHAEVIAAVQRAGPKGTK
jgi:phage gpG-like protein